MHDVAIVGAGPIGLEVQHELRRAGVSDIVHVDKDAIGSTVYGYPREVTFFSSTDRIAICGVPIQTPGQRKCTREEYLAYLRSVVAARGLLVRTFEEVQDIGGTDGDFFLRTSRGEARARKVVLATGDMARPRRLGVEGEDLPHVRHRFVDPHPFFRRRVLVVGGKNSAVEAALRCWHAGADVAMSYRRDAFDEKAVKYWILPELKGRIHRGEIECRYSTVPVRFEPGRAVLDDGSPVEADFVLVLIGFEADPRLFRMAGVTLDGTRPRFDEQTMETDVKGVFVAGTASAGAQQTYTLFIENCHIHARRIAAALTGQPPPPRPPPLTVPES